jgi:hypothetical protein
MTDEKITAAVAGITAPPTPDPKGLLDIAASVRAQIASAKVDPTHYAFGKPDVIAKMEQGLVISLARAGVTEPAFNPAAAAEAAHDASFRVGEWNQNFEELVAGHIDGLAEQHTDTEIDQMAVSLRGQVGAVEYDSMLAAARRVYDGELPDAVRASLPVLRLLSVQDRYNETYQRTRPKF